MDVDPSARAERLLAIPPIALFRELTRIPAVSYNEYLVYRFLRAHWRRVAGELSPEQATRLDVSFTASGQLRARWRGDPESRRRLVLVAHVDREGFLVDSVADDRSSCEGWPATGEDLEEERYGKSVVLTFGEGRFDGTIEPAGSSSEGSRVRFAIGDRLGDGLDLFDTPQVAGIGTYKLDDFSIDPEGVISSPCVDNAAGVSVVTAVLEGVTRASWKVNLDVLYTGCEEGGFCGIVRHILNDPHDVEDREVTWVVVDSSSHKYCHFEHLPGALRHPLKISEEPVQEADLRSTIIRTADKNFAFSREVSRMLHIASWNALRKLALYRQDASGCGLQEEFVFCDLLPETGTTDHYLRADVRGARMSGGWCEASPLSIAHRIVAAFGSEKKIRAPRVGSVAIPLGNWRYTFQGKLASEKCHVTSLLLACNVLGEATKLHGRFAYRNTASKEPVYLGEKSVEHELEQLRSWYERSERPLEVTSAWIESQV